MEQGFPYPSATPVPTRHRAEPPPSGFLSCRFLFEGFFSLPQLVTDRPHPRSRGPAFRRPCADRSDLAILRPAGDPCPAPRRPGEVLRRPLPSHPCVAGSRDSLRRRLPSRLRRRFPRCSSSPARSAPPPLAPCPSCSSPRLKPWILPQFWLGKRVIWRNSNLSTDWPSDSVYFCDDELNTDLKKFSFSIKLFRWALLWFYHFPIDFFFFLVNFPHPQIISMSYWLVSLCEMRGLILVPTHVSDQRARGNERPQPQPALIWIQPVEHPMLSCWAPAPSLQLSFLLF